MPAGAAFYIRGAAPARDTPAHTPVRARKEAAMAATYDGNLKILEQKMKLAGLYHTSLRPTMKECANVMTRIHHYNAEHVRQKYRTALPDGKRPPELMALENASRELLNYLKALGLVADPRKQERAPTSKAPAEAPASSPMAALERILMQHESGDDP